MEQNQHHDHLRDTVSLETTLSINNPIYEVFCLSWILRFRGTLLPSSSHFMGRTVTRGPSERCWKNRSYAVLNGFLFPLALDCNFDRGGLCRGVSQNSNDKFDWRVRKGRTPSSGTGPSGDVSGTGRLAWSIDLSRQLI